MKVCMLHPGEELLSSLVQAGFTIPEFFAKGISKHFQFNWEQSPRVLDT